MTRSAALLRAGMLVLPLAGYALILRLPQAGEIGMALRYRFDMILLPVVGLLWLALLPKGRLGITTGLAATLALFGLPLTGLWASAAGEMHVLGGLLYFSDTAGFYWDASRLLEGGLFSAFASRRPLFAGLLAGLLGLAGHNLQLALAALVGLCALGCFLAARALRQTHGPAAGALFLLLLFLFYRRFIGMTDTENLGLTLGGLAFALLWQGARPAPWQPRAQRRLILSGALLLALALAARAGAFLVLPALVIWATWRAHGVLLPARGGRVLETLTAGAMVCAAAVLGLALNMLVFRFTASGQDAPFANFAHTFYGMAAGGKGWTQIYQDAPEAAALPEAQAARAIYSLAWELVRQDPARFGRAVLDQFAGFFSLGDESAFGFAAGADLVIFDAPRSENRLLYRAARLLLGGLSLVGLWVAFRRKDALHSLLLWLAGGMVLSVAFLPPHDAGIMRVYAATLPLLAALPAVGLAGLAGLARKRPAEPPDPGTAWALPALGLGLALAVVAAPLTVRLLARPALPPSGVSCLPGEQAVTVRISPGAYLRVVEDGAAPRTWLPEVRRSDYLAGLGSFPHRADLPGLEKLPTPALLQNAVDLETGQAFWLVLAGGTDAPRAIGDPPVVVRLCGYWDAELQKRNFYFFFGLIPEG